MLQHSMQGQVAKKYMQTFYDSHLQAFMIYIYVQTEPFYPCGCLVR